MSEFKNHKKDYTIFPSLKKIWNFLKKSIIFRRRKILIIDDIKRRNFWKTSQPNTTSKILESNEKSEKIEKNEVKKAIQNNFPFYYIILTISALGLSMLMTAVNIKLGKPALISNEFDTSTINFKILEEANDNNQDLEISSIGQDMKLNIN